MTRISIVLGLVLCMEVVSIGTADERDDEKAEAKKDVLQLTKDLESGKDISAQAAKIPAQSARDRNWP